MSKLVLHPTTVIDRLIHSPNDILLYGAANCAESIYQSLLQYDRSPKGLFVDDPYVRPDAVFHGMPIQTFAQASAASDAIEVAIAIGTALPSVQTIKSHPSVKQVHQNVGYARGLAIDARFLRDHRADLEEAYAGLADEHSRQTLQALLDAKTQGDYSAFARLRAEGQYYGVDFLPLTASEVLVDCGAFTGDSVESFVHQVNGRYQKIYAWEPDPANTRQLRQYIESAQLNNVTVVECCAFSHAGQLTYDANGSATAFITDAGGEIVEAETIDHLCPDATFIKMDVEGSELEALKGAAEVIRSNKPKLAIAAYHRREDIIDIPRFILSLRPDYKLYLRIHRESADDIILYAV